LRKARTRVRWYRSKPCFRSARHKAPARAHASTPSGRPARRSDVRGTRRGRPATRSDIRGTRRGCPSPRLDKEIWALDGLRLESVFLTEYLTQTCLTALFVHKCDIAHIGWIWTACARWPRALRASGARMVARRFTRGSGRRGPGIAGNWRGFWQAPSRPFDPSGGSRDPDDVLRCASSTAVAENLLQAVGDVAPDLSRTEEVANEWQEQNQVTSTKAASYRGVHWPGWHLVDRLVVGAQ